MRLARTLLLAASAVAVFMAFGWPFVVGADASSAAYRVVSVLALCVFLGAIAFILAMKVRAHRVRP